MKATTFEGAKTCRYPSTNLQPSQVKAMVLSPDGKWVATVDETTIIIWGSDNINVARSWWIACGGVFPLNLTDPILRFSADSSRIALSTVLPHRIRIWSLEQDNDSDPLMTIRCLNSGLFQSCVWSPVGRALAVTNFEAQNAVAAPGSWQALESRYPVSATWKGKHGSVWDTDTNTLVHESRIPTVRDPLELFGLPSKLEFQSSKFSSCGEYLAFSAEDQADFKLNNNDSRTSRARRVMAVIMHLPFRQQMKCYSPNLGCGVSSTSPLIHDITFIQRTNSRHTSLIAVIEVSINGLEWNRNPRHFICQWNIPQSTSADCLKLEPISVRQVDCHPSISPRSPAVHRENSKQIIFTDQVQHTIHTLDIDTMVVTSLVIPGFKNDWTVHALSGDGKNAIAVYSSLERHMLLWRPQDREIASKRGVSWPIGEALMAFSSDGRTFVIVRTHSVCDLVTADGEPLLLGGPK